MLYHLTERLPRAIKWFFRMYNNHDFEHACLVEAIRYKLVDMEKVIRIHGGFIGQEFTAARIRVILRHLENSKNYDHKNLFALLTKKYGEITWTKKGWEYAKAKNPEENDYINRLFSRIYLIQDKYTTKEYNLFWKRLHRNHYRFWS